MDSSEIFTYDQRKIFHPEKTRLRWTLVTMLVIIGFASYIFLYNLLLGSFFLFLAVYLMGGFKTRKRIEVFVNTSRASIANEIVNLINSSREELKIFSGFLDTAIYCQSDIVNALDFAIKRGVRVLIITDYAKAVVSANEKHDEINSVLEWAKQNRLQLFDYGEETHNYNHFIIADRRSFRLEAMHQKGIEDRTAIIAYNNKRAEKLLVFFDKLIKYGRVKTISKEEIQLC